MAFLSLIFGREKSTIGAIPLDALLSESTDLNSRVTEYAVENGSPISDHIIQQPEEVRITGDITAASVVIFGSSGRSELIAAKDQFRAIHAAREPVTVVTGLDVYENFGITDLNIARDNGAMKYRVTATLRQINKVQLQRAKLPPEKAMPAKNAQGESLGPGTGAKGKVGETQDGGKVDGKELGQEITSDLREGIAPVLDLLGLT